MKKIVLFTLFTMTIISTISNGMKKSSTLWVRTSDDVMVEISKKNNKQMIALDFLNAHQHKDFQCITLARQSKNSYKNPLQACQFAITGEQLQLVHAAIANSTSKKQLTTFYLNCKLDERTLLCDVATKVYAEKIIEFIKSRSLHQDIQQCIISYIPRILSIPALHNVLIRNTSPQSTNFSDHQGPPTAATWNHDGSFLISCARNSIIRDGHTGKHIRTIQDLSHQNNCMHRFMHYIPDSSCIMIATNKGFTIQDYDTKKKIQSCDILYSAIASNPSHTRFIIARNNIIYLFNMSDGTLIKKTHEDRNINTLAWSPDGEFFISGGDDKKLYRWDKHCDTKKLLVDDKDFNAITCTCFSFDSTLFISRPILEHYGSPRSLHIRNSTTGEIVTIITYNGTFCAASFSPDNQHVIVGLLNLNSYSEKPHSILEVWKIASNTKCNRVAEYRSLPSICRFINIPHSSLLIVECEKRMYIFDDKLTINWMFTKTALLACSPDGKRIATNTNGKLIIWNLFTDATTEIIEVSQSNNADLFDIYLFNELCKQNKKLKTII